MSCANASWQHPLQKKGTVLNQMGETTPFVFNDRFYRLENYQRFLDFPAAAASDGYRFMEDQVRVWDVEAQRLVSTALVGHSFGFAFVHGGRVYVFAARHRADRPWRTFTAIDMTSSDDLLHWTPPQTVIEAEEVARDGQPGQEYLFNTAVCRATTESGEEDGAPRFVLLYETDDPRWPAFTFKYCESNDLLHWRRIPGALYGREKYVGGPALYSEGGWFYTLYLQDLNGYHGGTWETRLTRSKDLIHWEDAPLDRPFLAPDPSRIQHYPRGDKLIEVREVNASDAELVCWQGKTLVYFNGGDQQTLGDLQMAEFEGTPRQLFEHFYAEPTLPLPAPRQLALQERQFGAFIHYGMAAWYEGGAGQNPAKANFPPGLYQPHPFDLRHWGLMVAQPPASTFNPTQLDAEQWIGVAKAMGAQHVVLTAKHHNGYCLWPTATTEYCVRSSPWRGGQGDVVGDFVRAARRQGLGVGLYLSAGDVNAGCFSTPQPQGERQLIGDLERYFPILRAQFNEILNNYGELCEVWLDGALDPIGVDVLRPDGTPVGRRYWDELVALIRRCQPDAAIMGGTQPDLRWPGNEDGLAPYPLFYVVEPGQEAENYLLPGCTGWIVPEADVFTRPTWFWTPDSDDRILSLAQLMEIYHRSIGHGANLLVNLTPDRRGLIAEAEAARMSEFGREIKHRFAAPLRTQAWDENHALQFDLGGSLCIEAVLLEEDLRFGQRVLRYRLEARQAGQWTPLAEGQTIGRRRIERLAQPVTAEALRLRILETQPMPKIKTFAAIPS